MADQQIPPFVQEIDPNQIHNQTVVVQVNGHAYEVPVNATLEQIQAQIAAEVPASKAATLGLTGPGGAKGPGFDLPAGLNADDAHSMLATLLNSGALAATAGGPELSLILNPILGALSGSLNGGLTTSDTGMNGAIAGGLENAILGGFSVVSKNLPNLFNKGAFRLGGFGPEEAKDSAKALETINEGRGGPLRPFRRRLAVGAEGKTNKLLNNELGPAVDASRAADTNMHDLGEIYLHAKDAGVKGTANSMTPLSDAKDLTGRLGKSYEEQALSRSLAPSHVPMNTNTFGDKPVLGGEGPTRRITTSELRKFETDLKHSNAANNFRKAKDSGNAVSSADFGEGRLNVGLSDSMRQAAYDAESKPFASHEVSGPMQEADRRYAAGKTVQSANTRMRSPETFAEPGKMGARGGLGSGLGRNIGAMVAGGAGGASVGGVPGAIAGGLAGPFLFSPSGLSKTGYILDDLFRLLEPTAQGMKTYDSATRENEADRKRKAKRRSPK